MKTANLGLNSWTVSIAVAALLAGCGGGTADDTTAPPAVSGTLMQPLALLKSVSPPLAPSCVAASTSVANIDFGQISLVGDNSLGGPLPVAAPVQASVSFTDAVKYTHTAKWLWGDGTSANGIIAEAAGAGNATQTHSYAAAGIYNISAIVTNNVCPAVTVTRQLVVYDPAGGFVTGGGWMNSPAGAFKSDPSLTARLNFGFVAKYHQGAAIPDGQTEFQFQAADFNFHSDAYEWLIVAGAQAQYRGTGSVNGTSGFKFLLTVIDGHQLANGKGTDRLRMKIWHTNENNSDVVDYDNQIDLLLEGGNNQGTALEGGNIVVHN